VTEPADIDDLIALEHERRREVLGADDRPIDTIAANSTAA
jgi:hypothetical protein